MLVIWLHDSDFLGMIYVHMLLFYCNWLKKMIAFVLVLALDTRNNAISMRWEKESLSIEPLNSHSMRDLCLFGRLVKKSWAVVFIKILYLIAVCNCE